MEDISPARGMTPKMARQISDYAATRGIDVVPGTNVLSHMEGWFRLERIAQLSDGANHSYPVLTRPEVWDMVRPALDAIADAFPSKNFHAGLDELLFTGTNPQAIDAIETHGKPLYFATFARRVIDHLQARGKTVWIWDDMVMGKNVYRKEGFNDEYQKALDQIPRDVMMTHWYYWTNHDGKHTPIIERVIAAGRPWVVAPSARAHTTEFGSLKITLENQTYMADVGLKRGAFGFVNTNWENRLGVTFAVGWPLLALAGGYAWSGAPEKQEYENQNDILNAWGFVLGGDLHGSLAKYWRHLEAAQDIVRARECDLRHTLIAQGPIEMWRNATTYFKPEDRRAFLTHIDAAVEAWNVASPQDQMLRLALALPWTLARVCVRILDSLDQAWIHYHHAAVIERDASKKAEFIDEIDATVECIEAVENSLVTYRQALETISKTTGHTPYDAITLKRYERDLFELGKLVHRVAASGDGLPHFARLLNRPDFYFGSNAEQIQIQNTFHRPRPYRRWLQLPQ